MKRAIATREIIAIAEAGIILRGTYHRAQCERSNSVPGASVNDVIGVLFLNSGFHPRAGTADSSVHWADAFAKCGYPCFRIDLPGLGDSDGDLPEDVLEFVGLVNAGHYAQVLSGVTQKLCERFGLSGVVVMGHCAGAVSAVWAAANIEHVKGLILLNPFFHREEPEAQGLRNQFRSWVPRSRVAAYLSAMYGRLKHVCSLVRSNPLPANANIPLLRCWNQLASAGLPILVFKALAPNPRIGDFDYVAHVQRSSPATQRIQLQCIEDTNHAFVKGPGKAAVQKHAESWLSTHFPPAAPAISKASDRDSLRMEMGRVDSLGGAAAWQAEPHRGGD